MTIGVDSRVDKGVRLDALEAGDVPRDTAREDGGAATSLTALARSSFSSSLASPAGTRDTGKLTRSSPSA